MHVRMQFINLLTTSITCASFDRCFSHFCIQKIQYKFRYFAIPMAPTGLPSTSKGMMNTGDTEMMSAFSTFEKCQSPIIALCKHFKKIILLSTSRKSRKCVMLAIVSQFCIQKIYFWLRFYFTYSLDVPQIWHDECLRQLDEVYLFKMLTNIKFVKL